MNYYIHYNGGKVYYTDNGEGETVVLLHGYLENSSVWNGFASRLVKTFRVISVDLPGHGLSKVYGECHTMEFMAGAVKALVDNLNLNKVILAGHSMGGYVTLAFAEAYPELLKGYCLFHSHPFADTPETLKKRENEIRVVKSGKKYLVYPESVSKMFAATNIGRMHEAVARSKDIASGISDEGIIAVLNGMMVRPSRIRVMEEGKIPCLWILGQLDNYIVCDEMRSRVNIPSGSTVAILGNSGHMGFVEEEELSAGIFTSFARGLN
ncbi:MAG: alpha/beta hydrolase [Bacteroidales bacterium]|jgi:pimeloyl-ACP methyl ester carboxylesterase|nr:alpha/beta hydrolase [Bacteroidales bacterium]